MIGGGSSVAVGAPTCSVSTRRAAIRVAALAASLPPAYAWKHCIDQMLNGREAVRVLVAVGLGVL